MLSLCRSSFVLAIFSLGGKELTVSSTGVEGGLVHLSSVHSWCHFITHILNISKHCFKCVCACVCVVGGGGGGGGGGELTSEAVRFVKLRRLMDVSSRCTLDVAALH